MQRSLVRLLREKRNRGLYHFHTGSRLGMDTQKLANSVLRKGVTASKDVLAEEQSLTYSYLFYKKNCPHCHKPLESLFEEALMSQTAMDTGICIKRW